MSATHLSHAELALISALRAIVAETMDYPPLPHHSTDSYLPPVLIKQAQDALAQYGLHMEPADVADDIDSNMSQTIMHMVSAPAPLGAA